MKIYFGLTVAGDLSSVATATKIVDLLMEMGHEVLTCHCKEQVVQNQSPLL